MSRLGTLALAGALAVATPAPAPAAAKKPSEATVALCRALNEKLKGATCEIAGGYNLNSFPEDHRKAAAMAAAKRSQEKISPANMVTCTSAPPNAFPLCEVAPASGVNVGACLEIINKPYEVTCRGERSDERVR